MKTFEDLKLGDTLYFCNSTNYKISECQLLAIVNRPSDNEDTITLILEVDGCTKTVSVIRNTTIYFYSFFKDIITTSKKEALSETMIKLKDKISELDNMYEDIKSEYENI